MTVDRRSVECAQIKITWKKPSKASLSTIRSMRSSRRRYRVPKFPRKRKNNTFGIETKLVLGKQG